METSPKDDPQGTTADGAEAAFRPGPAGAEGAAGLVPPQPSAPPPAPPPMPPQQFGGSVSVRVSKRILWVGNAAYPLENVTRVYTFTMTPKRREPILLCVKRVALTLTFAISLTILVGLASAFSHSGGGYLDLVWMCTVAALAYSVGEMVYVLSRPALPALAVETSGPSSAVVSSHDTHHLHQLLGSISHAIENPEAAFQLTVGTLTFSAANYHFGDNVNMYGGSGNTGVTN